MVKQRTECKREIDVASRETAHGPWQFCFKAALICNKGKADLGSLFMMTGIILSAVYPGLLLALSG